MFRKNGGTQEGNGTLGMEDDKDKSLRTEASPAHALADDISGSFSDSLFDLLPETTLANLNLGAPAEKEPDWAREETPVLDGMKSPFAPGIETATQHAAADIGLICGILGMVKRPESTRASDNSLHTGCSSIVKQDDNQTEANTSKHSKTIVNSSTSGNESMRLGTGMKLLAPDDE
jgi:hypothetical protein